MTRGNALKITGFVFYAMFAGVSFWLGYEPGEQIGRNFATFALEMLQVLPCAFLLIGLFEVWVKRETIEKHFGDNAGFLCYFWAVALAGTTVGPFYMTFPVSHALAQKGAKLSVIFTYISASAVCRIPMTTFEVSFLGLKFTIVRWLVSLPLIILSSILLGRYLSARSYVMRAEK